MELNNLLLFPLLILTPKVTGTHDQVLILGGKGVKKVNVIGLMNTPSGDCNLIPNVPFEPLHSIGLRDNQGRAMVCGGNKNPNPKSCWILDRANNTWIQGPNLKRERVGAAAVCLDNGICWIFGGKSKSFTEWYNPETNAFEMGPEMPVNSVHGLCAVYAPISDLVFIAARREPGKTRRFTFNATSKEFKEYHPLEGVDVRYAACGVADYYGEDEFVMVGGGTGIEAGTGTGFYMDPYFYGGDTYFYPYELYGAVGIPVEAAKTFMVAGGVTPTGEYPTEVYSYYTYEVAWHRQVTLSLDPPRAFPIAVTVQAEDCPCV